MSTYEKRQANARDQVQQDVRMVGGSGETSYANNSIAQKTALCKSRSTIRDAILELDSSIGVGTFYIADLGCSSGSNCLYTVPMIIDAIGEKSRQNNQPFPEVLLFLNDLPENDFNSVFKSLPGFFEKLKGEKVIDSCCIAAMPGSFYTKLFPSRTLHFVHSSYSLHWLSKVPPGLQGEVGIPLNKGNIYLSKTSPGSVLLRAYLEQFQKDFSSFLKHRSKEVIPRGRMVLTFIGRDSSSEDFNLAFQLLSEALKDMVQEGLVKEGKLDEFNMPFYTPSVEELKNVIEKEGSFQLDREQITGVNVYGGDDEDSKSLALHDKSLISSKHIRAVSEPLLASHFGEAIMDELFRKYASRVAAYLSEGKLFQNVTLIISMIRRG